MTAYLGVDVGATTTKVAVADEHGQLLASGSGGPGGFLFDPAERQRVAAVVAAAVDDVLTRAGCRWVRAAYLAVTGLGFGRTVPELAAALADCAEAVFMDADPVAAHAGALGGGAGTVVIAGTGSVAYASDGSRWARAGGWGYLLGDQGSAYDLGRRGLVAALRSLDGRGPATALLAALAAAVDELWGLPWDPVQGPGELVSLVYRRSTKADLAALAPAVLGRAAAGDPVAMDIRRQGAFELARLAVAAAGGAGLGRAPVALVGGTLTDAGYRQAVTTAVSGEGLAVVAPAAGPLWGAITLAAKRAGTPLLATAQASLADALGRPATGP